MRTNKFLDLKRHWGHSMRRDMHTSTSVILGLILLSLVLSVDGDFYGKSKGDENRLCFCQVSRGLVVGCNVQRQPEGENRVGGKN